MMMLHVKSLSADTLEANENMGSFKEPDTTPRGKKETHQTDQDIPQRSIARHHRSQLITNCRMDAVRCQRICAECAKQWQSISASVANKDKETADQERKTRRA